MKKLFCFTGKPGCGKTTLLTQLRIKHYDVLKHIKKYLDENGKLIDESFTIKAYKDLFEELKTVEDKPIFLELGTNHHEFVMKNLKEFDTTIFFCLLDKNTCFSRQKQRGRKISTEQLMRRLDIVFPDNHLEHISELKYEYLNMGKSLEENAEIVRRFM